MSKRLSVVVGADVFRGCINRIKYLPLLSALENRFQLVGIHDASLHGIPRLWNALRTFHPRRTRWKQQFYRNVPAFIAASRKAARLIRKDCSQAQGPELIFQLGVLLDASLEGEILPHVIYTDHTAALAGDRIEFGRALQRDKERGRWLALEKASFQRAAHIFTFGSQTRNSLVERYDIPAERVTAVGGGVSIDPLPDADRPRGDGQNLLFIGNELMRKGGDLLLQAFQRVRRRHPRAQLRMVTRDDPPRDLPLEGVVWGSPGNDRRAVLELFAHADLFVLPSRLETWGDVLLEAMAFGLPCVGVRGQSMQDMIVDGETGYLVPPDDAVALADALTKLLDDPSRRRAFGRAGRRRLEERFTWPRVMNRIGRVIDRLPGDPAR